MRKSNQEGQALIELVIFLPLMFTLYSLISGFADAIHGSINQQKITRSYFYFRAQNNSTIPKPDGSTNGFDNRWRKFGMFFIGWRESMGTDNVPVLTCYKVSLPLGGVNETNCANYDRPSSQFIRVGTVYGICGATYTADGSQGQALPMLDYGNPTEVSSESGCLIQY